MAAITDLTWAQLNTALGGSDKIAVASGKVVIDVSAVTGDTVDALTKTGVVEFFCKCLEAAARAQITANEGQISGERLAAFPLPVYGTVTSGSVQLTQSMTARVSINPATQNSIVGTNV